LYVASKSPKESQFKFSKEAVSTAMAIVGMCEGRRSPIDPWELEWAEDVMGYAFKPDVPVLAMISNYAAPQVGAESPDCFLPDLQTPFISGGFPVAYEICTSFVKASRDITLGTLENA
ncbi:MAG TPA: hypothetical protein VNT79_01925, partial [Phycisphaerae bacterium]|nr:hypothetical protein [Phycisphaerae bacterium]